MGQASCTASAMTSLVYAIGIRFLRSIRAGKSCLLLPVQSPYGAIKNGRVPVKESPPQPTSCDVRQPWILRPGSRTTLAHLSYLSWNNAPPEWGNNGAHLTHRSCRPLNMPLWNARQSCTLAPFHLPSQIIFSSSLKTCRRDARYVLFTHQIVKVNGQIELSLFLEMYYVRDVSSLP